MRIDEAVKHVTKQYLGRIQESLWSRVDVENRIPNSHLHQFKRYIRDTTDTRVNCFMSVVPDVDEDAGSNCIRLKHESQHDADVSIISAEDLKWVAENWKDYASGEEFNLAVFDQTGPLTRGTLLTMMGVLL